MVMEFIYGVKVGAFINNVKPMIDESTYYYIYSLGDGKSYRLCP